MSAILARHRQTTRLHLTFVVESGTDVRLVEGLAERTHLNILARRIEGGVELSRVPSTTVPVTVGSSSRLVFTLRVLRHLLRARRSVDWVLVQGYGLAALAANLAARVTATPTFMLVCSPIERYYRCRRKHGTSDKVFRAHELALLRLLARLNAKLGRHYVVLSHHLEEVVRQHGSKLPVSIIPVYGVDTELFRPATEPRNLLRRRRGLSETGAVIFFSSRIAPEKDAETLLNAVRTLRTAGREVWVLHRSGGYRALLAAAERCGVADRVIATDAVHPQHELPADYQASDLCVQASREEGLGFSPLEALACEIPVIATAVGGLRETIVDGETGWTYPMGDAAGLAHTIERVLANPEEARRRAATGRAMVRQRFESRMVFDRLARLLNEARM